MIREKIITIFGGSGLDGNDFSCATASSPLLSPVNQGSVVGMQIKYVTGTEEHKVIDNRRQTPLRGCSQFDSGLCSVAKKTCPVASVRSIGDFRARVNELKTLKQILD